MDRGVCRYDRYRGPVACFDMAFTSNVKRPYLSRGEPRRQDPEDRQNRRRRFVGLKQLLRTRGDGAWRTITGGIRR